MENLESLVVVSEKVWHKEFSFYQFQVKAVCSSEEQAQKFVVENQQENEELVVNPFIHLAKEATNSIELENIESLEGETYFLFHYEYLEELSMHFELSLVGVFSDKKKAKQAKQALNEAFKDNEYDSFEIEQAIDGVRTGIIA